MLGIQMTKARAHKAVKMLTKPCQEVALVIGTATEEAIAVDIPIEVMYKVVRMPSWRGLFA